MSHEIFGVGGGQMYREGWQHEEIRVAAGAVAGQGRDRAFITH